MNRGNTDCQNDGNAETDDDNDNYVFDVPKGWVGRRSLSVPHHLAIESIYRVARESSCPINLRRRSGMRKGVGSTPRERTDGGAQGWRAWRVHAEANEWDGIVMGDGVGVGVKRCWLMVSTRPLPQPKPKAGNRTVPGGPSGKRAEGRR